jgi:hypothetical protein
VVTIFGRPTPVELEYWKWRRSDPMAKEITAKIKLQCPAGKATPAPPVGPALGSHGVQHRQFVKEFNDARRPMGLIHSRSRSPSTRTAASTSSSSRRRPRCCSKKAAGIEKASGNVGHEDRSARSNARAGRGDRQAEDEPT